jgi:hypothetical protein
MLVNRAAGNYLSVVAKSSAQEEMRASLQLCQKFNFPATQRLEFSKSLYLPIILFFRHRCRCARASQKWNVKTNGLGQAVRGTSVRGGDIGWAAEYHRRMRKFNLEAVLAASIGLVILVILAVIDWWAF